MRTNKQSQNQEREPVTTGRPTFRPRKSWAQGVGVGQRGTSQELWRGAIAFDNPFQSTIFLSRPQFLSSDSLGGKAGVSSRSPQSGTPGVPPSPPSVHCTHSSCRGVSPPGTLCVPRRHIWYTGIPGRRYPCVGEGGGEVGQGSRTLSHSHLDGRWPALEGPHPQSIRAPWPVPSLQGPQQGTGHSDSHGAVC